MLKGSCLTFVVGLVVPVFRRDNSSIQGCSIFTCDGMSNSSDVPVKFCRKGTNICYPQIQFRGQLRYRKFKGKVSFNK